MSLDHVIVGPAAAVESRYTSPLFAPERGSRGPSTPMASSPWNAPFINAPALHTPSSGLLTPSSALIVTPMGSSHQSQDFFSYKPRGEDAPPRGAPPAAPRATVSTIDHDSYPHIIEQILQESSWEALNAFRGSCRKYRDRVHAILTRQLIFFLATSAPRAIRSPRGRIPSLMILQTHNCDHSHPSVANMLRHTRVIDVIASPREHAHSACAFALAFRKRDVVIRFHPTSHLHDVEEPVSARKVVLFGTSVRSSWKGLPPPHWGQEKTVANLRRLNNPHELVAAFRRFPPSTGCRQAVVVFTHWGADMGYTVPIPLNELADPRRLARQRLSIFVDVAAGMVVGGWLFPDMPPVTFTIVDFGQVSAHEFALDPNSDSDSDIDLDSASTSTSTGNSDKVGRVAAAHECSVVDELRDRIYARIAEMVAKLCPLSTPVPERKTRTEAALARVYIITLAEYAARLGDEEVVELDTVQLRYSSNI